MHTLEQFTHLYPVQKTLRFALKPTEKTLENIKKGGFIESDESLAEKYKLAKKVIDEYHKNFIHNTLSDFCFKSEDLNQFFSIYMKLKNTKKGSADFKNYEKEYNDIQKVMRNAVAGQFNSAIKGHKLFEKNFIEQVLPNWLEQNPIEIDELENPLSLIQDFHKWSTYFQGFYKNRKNIYDKSDHTTAIGYRLIHENLPKFIENSVNYYEAKKHGVDFGKVVQDFSEELESKDIKSLDELFSLEYYNHCLTQEGIDFYNLIRGARTRNSNSQNKQGINVVLNLFSQQKKHELAQATDDEKESLKEKIRALNTCKLGKLYKQILSDRTTFSYRLDNLKNDAELCHLIAEHFFCNDKGDFISRVEMNGSSKNETPKFHLLNLNEELEKLVDLLREAKPKALYLNKKDLGDISKHLFEDWSLINNALEYYAENEYLRIDTKTKEPKKFTKAQREKWLKRSDKPYFSICKLHTAIEFYAINYLKEDESNQGEDRQSEEVIDLMLNQPLNRYFSKQQIEVKESNNSDHIKVGIFEKIKDNYEATKPILEQYKNIEDERLKNDRASVEIIRSYLESVLELFHFLKPLSIKPKPENLDASFYTEFDEIYESLEYIVPLFNKARNYLTKKKFSIEKFKLNFGNSTLAHGWDKNKETDNTCVIFLKENRYFLGVMPPKHKNIFCGEMPSSENNFRKMNYKLLPGASKMLPKVFFSDKNISDYSPSVEILRILNHGTHTKGGKSQKGYEKQDFNLNDCHKIIDFFKDSIELHPDWKEFDFIFSPTKSYENISDFYKEVENQGYRLTFQNIASDFIYQCIEEGKLFLFEIYSKDFSTKSKGRPNLQTLYWKALFDDTNLKDVIYKLNGEAELFFRKASIKYSKEKSEQGHHYDDQKAHCQKLGKNFFPIIKDRRYSQDQFFFHVPTTLNFKAEKRISKFNQRVNDFLYQNPEVKIIGIDRGERHLAYYTLIDQKGNILKQETLNYVTVDASKAPVDYHQKLEDKEKERDLARKSWGTIEKIKDLKAGYLSQVVHKLAKLMEEHNAIVVFEDLNYGFKKGRFKIEKQVYQKLEKALIDKLNYLVFKDRQLDEVAGLYQALQLTEKFKSFKDLGKQTGFLFYVPAYYTSKVCPVTGFVNLLYPKCQTINQVRDFLGNFESIQYLLDEDLFKFSFNYSKSKAKERAKGYQQEWEIYSFGERLINFRNPQQNNHWDTKEIVLTTEFKNLFDEYKLDYAKGDDLKGAIIEQTEKAFFVKIIQLLKYTLQMRNSRINSEEDWMISPVKDKSGQFFDSRHGSKNLPENADANGAYHIALKGLMLLRQLNQTTNFKNDGKFKPDLTNKKWYEFILNK